MTRRRAMNLPGIFAAFQRHASKIKQRSIGVAGAH